MALLQQCSLRHHHHHHGIAAAAAMQPPPPPSSSWVGPSVVRLSAGNKTHHSSGPGVARTPKSSQLRSGCPRTQISSQLRSGYHPASKHITETVPVPASIQIHRSCAAVAVLPGFEPGTKFYHHRCHRQHSINTAHCSSAGATSSATPAAVLKSTSWPMSNHQILYKSTPRRR